MSVVKKEKDIEEFYRRLWEWTKSFKELANYTLTIKNSID
jgi:hypothetical protein